MAATARQYRHSGAIASRLRAGAASCSTEGAAAGAGPPDGCGFGLRFLWDFNHQTNS